MDIGLNKIVNQESANSDCSSNDVRDKFDSFVETVSDSACVMLSARSCGRAQKQNANYSTSEQNACAAKTEETYNNAIRDRYNPSILEEQTKVSYINFIGSAQKNPSYFGGHKFLPVTFFVGDYRNGIYDNGQPETVYCVLDGSNSVMGLEDKIDLDSGSP